MGSIEEGRESGDSYEPPLADAQPVQHRLVSQTVIGAARRPSLSMKVKRQKVPGAADLRMTSEPSTPSEEDVRRFYALYGRRMEPTGRRPDVMPVAAKSAPSR